MILEEILDKLIANKPFDILKEIIKFNNQKENINNLVSVRNILKTNSISGYPLKIDSEKNILIATQDNNLLYFNASTLIGIEVINPKEILSILTQGRYFEIAKNELLSDLELKRNFAKTQDFAKTNFGFIVKSNLLDTNLSVNTKFQFNQVLIILTSYFKKIIKDSLGKKALMNLTELHINSTNKTKNIKKHNTELIININFEVKFSTNFETELIELIEKSI